MFWNPLVCWLPNHTPLCARSLVPDWSDITLYNRYEFFYETLIVGILSYLVVTIPGAILRDCSQLFRLAESNKGNDGYRALFVILKSFKALKIFFKTPPGYMTGTMVLLIFLFDFALPWLALRQGIRCNDSDTLDIMWAIVLPWF